MGFAVHAEGMARSKAERCETCLIKVCLLWHYWAVKGENEAGGSSQITKDYEGHTKRHVGEGVCT